VEELLGHLKGAITLIEICMSSGISPLTRDQNSRNTEAEVQSHNVWQSVAVQIGCGDGKGAKSRVLYLAVVRYRNTQFSDPIAKKKSKLARIKS